MIVGSRSCVHSIGEGTRRDLARLFVFRQASNLPKVIRIVPSGSPVTPLEKKSKKVAGSESVQYRRQKTLAPSQVTRTPQTTDLKFPFRMRVCGMCKDCITYCYISLSDPRADPCPAAPGLSASFGGMSLRSTGVHRNREMRHQLMREAIIPAPR